MNLEERLKRVKEASDALAQRVRDGIDDALIPDED
jgi:hypothetical protein